MSPPESDVDGKRDEAQRIIAIYSPVYARDLERPGGPWDVAAPSLIVEEAGGRFTDLTGRHDFTSGTAPFSNGCLHDDVLRLVLGR